MHHESERQRLINEYQCKEVLLVSKFLQEKSELQDEARAQKAAFVQHQKEANERIKSL